MKNPIWLGHRVGKGKEERALKGIFKEMKKGSELSFQAGPWASLNAQQWS